MRKQIIPQISLVGAGPGDAELLTIKGLKAIKRADVILYDALVNPEILSYAHSHCLKIYVGKRAGHHRYPQTVINEMLVRYANSHGHVVRLKGGDPFVFGRGHEELQYAEAHGIPTVIVPGISSCIAVPAAQQIPLTSRHISESFWVITGTTTNGALSADLHLAAQSKATVVILMGTKKVSQICELYQREDKSETPIMIIWNGTTAKEKVCIGQISDIQYELQNHNNTDPGIIVIGDVVGYHEQYLGAYHDVEDLLMQLE